MKEKSTAEKVFETATRLFSEKGYDGVSVRDICTEAQVSMNAVHYHFQSKEQLYQTILTTFGERKLETAERVLQAPLKEPSELRTRLHIYMEETLISCLREPEALRISYTEFMQLFPHSIDQVPEVFVRHTGILSDFFAQAIKVGILRSEIDPDIVAGMICERLFNQAMFNQVFEKFYNTSVRDPQYRSHWIQQNLDLFLTGILKIKS